MCISSVYQQWSCLLYRGLTGFPDVSREGEAQAAEAAATGSGEAAATADAPPTPAKSAEPQPGSSESPKPVERQVESRTHVADDMASMVRSLYFADTFLLNSKSGHKVRVYPH